MEAKSLAVMIAFMFIYFITVVILSTFRSISTRWVRVGVGREYVGTIVIILKEKVFKKTI